MHNNLDNLTAYEVANIILCEQLDTTQSATLIEEYGMQKANNTKKQQTNMKTVKFEALIEARNKL